MKTTGIIRRIDDLGRIVIPLEIRRTMGISEGSPLELFLDEESGGITFVPYHSNVSSRIKGIAANLNAMGQTPEYWEIATELKAIADRLDKLDNE